MIRFFLLLLIFSSINCSGQKSNVVFTETDFNKQFLSYKPVNLGISEQKFKDALFILDQSKERIIKNNSQFDFLDYWNILVILNRLNESESNLEIAFLKFNKADGSCEYLTSPIFQKNFDNFSKTISAKLKEAASECPTEKETSFDITEYINNGKFDSSLVKLIKEIEDNDQRFRINEINLKKQKILDEINQSKIDSLYAKHKAYIGKTLVGTHFENVMWEVIQHSNLTFMEKYLPILHKAVMDKEINQTTLKYLLDRIVSEKSGFQYFGSQANIPITDKERIDEIKRQYQIE